MSTLYAGKAAYVAAARCILNCPALAEDVVQDVMLRLAAEPPEGVGTQGPYVARMVRNLAIDRARRRRFEWRTFARLDETIAGSARDGSDLEREAAAHQSLRRAEAAVESLPEPVRTAFRLHRIEGVPQSEIAARMGVSRALVCGLVRRGHVRCRAALDGPCREPDCPLDAAAQGGVGEHRTEPVGRTFRRQPSLSIVPRSGPRFAEENYAKSRKAKQAFVGRPANACFEPA